MPAPDALAPTVRSSPAAAGVRHAWETARREHGDLGLTAEELASEAAAAVRRRRAAAGLVCDEATLSTCLTGLALADLCLARACERGLDVAWRALQRAYAPRLVALLRKREGGALDAQSWVDEMLSELALPPSGGGARTRLASYDGSGSLLGWLAATLLRRLARRSRERVQPAGDMSERLATGQASPSAPLLAAEDAARLERALGEAWPRLEREERAALVWKFRHGLAQRHMATLWGVGEERVSRWVSRALAKLRGALEALASDGTGGRGSTLYAALVDALERQLARLDVETALPRSPAEGA